MTELRVENVYFAEGKRDGEQPPKNEAQPNQSTGAEEFKEIADDGDWPF